MVTNTEALIKLSRAYDSIEDKKAITQADFYFMDYDDISNLLSMLDDKDFKEALKSSAQKEKAAR